jgi:hypothetical protein
MLVGTAGRFLWRFLVAHKVPSMHPFKEEFKRPSCGCAGYSCPFLAA